MVSMQAIETMPVTSLEAPGEAPPEQNHSRLCAEVHNQCQQTRTGKHVEQPDGAGYLSPDYGCNAPMPDSEKKVFIPDFRSKNALPRS